MGELKVCVYAICKDEMKNVDRWYASMSNADLVCVVDTGSIDGTPERLKELGAKVKQIRPKTFRFDKARNSSVKFSRGECKKADPDADWIFACTDLDEAWNTDDWCDILKGHWAKGRHNRARYFYTNAGQDVHGELNWIHGYGWAWKYPCHEAIYRPNGNDIWYTHDECLDLSQYGVDLIHYKDITKSRSSYLPLLRLRYTENPDKADALAYLMRELMYHKEWDEILSLENDISFDADAAATCYVSIAEAYKAKGEYDKCADACRKASECFPAFRQPYVSYGDCMIKAGRAAEAIRPMIDAISTTEHVTMTQWPDDPAMFSWMYLDWISVVAYWAGDAMTALEYSAKALKTDPSNAHVQRNLDEAWKLYRRKGV